MQQVFSTTAMHAVHGAARLAASGLVAARSRADVWRRHCAFPAARLCTASTPPPTPDAVVSPDGDDAPAVSLTDTLTAEILTRGPISIAEFMRQALSHPHLGYYTTRDVFGTRGDFTTSPEISQMFGEHIGIWWEQLGQPKHLDLVELGPGRGTLMADVLRVAAQFPPFYEAVAPHLVDISPALTAIQRTTLGCTGTPRAVDGRPPVIPAGGDADVEAPSGEVLSRQDGKDVSWWSRFADVPTRGPVLVIAQELFDALPVHQFRKTERGWAEVLVDVTEQQSPAPGEELRLVLAPSATPGLAMAQRTLQAIEGAEDGATVEVSPASAALAYELGTRIGEQGGGALVIDYGASHAAGNSLRGIKDHKFVDVLHDPGNVDLSVDVDFAALAHAAESTNVAEVYGPITQSEFLQTMGIAHRLEQLLETVADDEDAQEKLFSEVHRLLHPDEMGSVYKVMALARKGDTVPVAFQSGADKVVE